MGDTRQWIIADDQLQDAEAFAASFEREMPVAGISWIAMQASDAQQYLLSDTGSDIAGVLVDVDLSSDGKMIGTGLGLAQDIRAKQKNRTNPTADYPVLRFANPDPVREYVGDDPASDDLFDLLVSKVLAREHPTSLIRQAIATRAVYDALIRQPPTDTASFSALCGLGPDRFEIWADARLWQRVRLGLAESSSLHVAAGTFLRTFLVPTGLLVDEEVLAIRLGVDRARSPGWPAVKDALAEAKFTGVGAEGFDRWWARGIEAYWLKLDEDDYLYQRTSNFRVERLSQTVGAELAFLEPSGAYWRRCALSLRRGEFRPIDPSRAVSLVQTGPLEPWVDPDQAAPDVAVMLRNDPRVDPEELQRLGL